MKSTYWTLAAACALTLGSAGAAHAQGAIAFAGTSMECQQTAYCTSTCTTDATCTATAGGGTLGRCVPYDSLVCCAGAGDCPFASAGSPNECVMVRGLTLESGGEQGICGPSTANWCPNGGDNPSIADIRECLTNSEGDQVEYYLGDCDQDGISNGDEGRLGSDPCAVPLRRGVKRDGACQLVIPCSDAVGSSCQVTENSSGPSGTCQLTESDGSDPLAAGLRCEPDEGEDLICGPGQGFDCLPGLEVEVFIGGFSYCAPRLCADNPGLDPALCITSTSGEAIPFDEGDCDGDGEHNRDEINGSRDPCRDENAPTDAGPTPDAGAAVDAGTPPPADAGQPFDAGAGEDAGQPLGARFQGGGGCACRVRPGDGPLRGAAALALLSLGALLMRRRRS